jgi:hypothetical protein
VTQYGLLEAVYSEFRADFIASFSDWHDIYHSFKSFLVSRNKLAPSERPRPTRCLRLRLEEFLNLRRHVHVFAFISSWRY